MRRLLMPAGVILALSTLAATAWLAQPARRDTTPAEGLVQVRAPGASPAPALAKPTEPAATLPAMPDQVIDRVRQAYPLLTDVDFRCEAKGCAVTATIPPPTGDEFLAKRQEMLLGGLARVIEANGYQALGPVQMDEVAFNTFRIRASVAQPKGRAL